MYTKNKTPFSKFFEDRGMGEESFLLRKFLPPYITHYLII